VLIVEDEQVLAEAIAEGLRREALAVDVAYDGDAALERLSVNEYDVLVLDRDLPLVHGDDVCRTVVASGADTRVLMLTAAGEIDERVAGLGLGADDYLSKPFAFAELVARIRALVRRGAGHGEPVFSHKGVVLNPATREASVDGEPVILSAREWAVLEPMIARPGAVFSRSQLEEKLYSWKDEISSNAVEVYVHGLRKKLGADFIHTVRGLGYVVPRE
jgi:two-component system OmpR family response regulator